jgi:hypothetical protein
LIVEDATKKFPEEAGIARFGKPEEIADLLAYMVSPAVCLWDFSDGNVCIASLSWVGFRLGVLRSAPLSAAGTSWNPRRRCRRQ